MAIKSVPTQNSIQKTLDSTLASAASSMVLNEDVSALVSNVSTTNPGVVVVDRIDSSGNLTPSKREYMTFTGVSSATLSGLTRNADTSGSDQEHAVGAIVEFIPDVLWAQSIQDTFENEHTAVGVHTNANLTTKGVVEIATAVETTTGSDAARSVSPDGLAGSTIFGVKTVALIWNAPDSDATTGTKKVYFVVPAAMNGMDLISVHAELATAGITDLETFDININGTTALSTKLTIDTTETGSDTAAAAAVIDTGADAIATNDVVSVDVDAIHSGTAGKGEVVTLEFKLP